jgi:hypothetical protein
MTSNTAIPAAGDLHFDVHGYFRAPFRVGSNSRPSPSGPNQSATIFHEPLLLDDQYLNWSYTRAQEKSLAELYFSFGNSLIVANLAVVANNFDDWERLSNAQLGISQGWLTVSPNIGRPDVRIAWRVGAFESRYGMAGRDDAGPYDTYLIGRTHQMGELLTAELDVAGGDVTLKAEHGIGAHGEEPVSPVNVTPVIANAFTVLHHAHLGASFFKRVELNLHYMNAFTMDSKGSEPEGSLRVLGADAKANGAFGYLYFGVASLHLSNALHVGPAIETVHSFGPNPFWLDFIGNLLGPGSQGNGTVNTLEGSYEYSFAPLWRKLVTPGAGLDGEGADARLGLFGLYSTVTSDVSAWDGLHKLKFGGDLAADVLSWLAIGMRFDRVLPNTGDGSIAFSTFSPRVVFRGSGWASRENVSLVYSHYAYGSALRNSPIANDANHPGLGLPRSYGSSLAGSGAFAETGGTGPIDRPPDSDVIAVKATMWW